MGTVPIDGKTLYVARVRSHRDALACLFAGCAVGTLVAAQGTADAAENFVDDLGFSVFLGMLAIALAIRSPLGLTARLGLGPGRFSRSALALAVLGTLGLSFALDGIHQLVETRQDDVLSQFEADLAGVRGRALAFALLSFAFAPGIAEELLCRGLLQRGLEARYSAATAIPLASLFFGALHMDPIYSVFAVALGLYLGCVAYLAGSVWPSIICHVVNNAVAVIAVALIPDFAPTEMAWVALAGAASLGALVGLWVHLGRPPGVAETATAGTQGLQRRAGSDDS